MKEIKFRAWQENDGAIGSHMNYDVLKEYTLSEIERWGWKLMQYTGLKDKNGKEIYEFDQLKGDWDVVNDIYLGTVEFYGGAFRIKETGLPLAWADKDKDCEVVGNKFEGLQNPSEGDI